LVPSGGAGYPNAGPQPSPAAAPNYTIPGAGGQPADFSSTFGLGQGPAPPAPQPVQPVQDGPGYAPTKMPNRPKLNQHAINAKKALALSLLVSALHAPPPRGGGFHPAN
nr:hypothetical protein [Propionibacteriales bacterium]